jgi:hypothetical protein
MKKILLATLLLVSLSVFARGGGGFSGSSHSSSSSSHSSSFGSSSRSSGTSTSKPSSSGRSSWFGSSTKSAPTTATPKGTPFAPSSRGFFGGSPTKSTFSGPQRYTAQSALAASPAVVHTPSQPISVYHYYYPTYYYGSGYSWYHYYFYYHMFGNHSNCYHSGGGLAVPRLCQKLEDCAHGETCDITKKQCVLRTGEWTN